MENREKFNNVTSITANKISFAMISSYLDTEAEKKTLNLLNTCKTYNGNNMYNNLQKLIHL